MAIRGLALYAAFSEYPGTRHNQRDRCCSDVPNDAVTQTVPRRRVRKLVTAVGMSLTVFVKLVQRPVGGTTVVLMPREQIPEASSAVVVSDEYELLPRAS